MVLLTLLAASGVVLLMLFFTLVSVWLSNRRPKEQSFDLMEGSMYLG
jgi:hypothetical protein